MSSSTASFRYNLRSRSMSTVTPSKGDLQAAQILMSLRSWTPATTASNPVAPASRREQPQRACRNGSSKTQKAWPTSTIAERVKARRAGADLF